MFTFHTENGISLLNYYYLRSDGMDIFSKQKPVTGLTVLVICCLFYEESSILSTDRKENITL